MGGVAWAEWGLVLEITPGARMTGMELGSRSHAGKIGLLTGQLTWASPAAQGGDTGDMSTLVQQTAQMGLSGGPA